MGTFKYHTGCEELKITNLCFADDLLVLCNGDCDSVKVIKLALEEFSSVSGLVKWVNIYRLKRRNLLEIPIDDNASWGWRKLMELRDQARPHIRHCLGKGESTSMWHDYWCDIGPIDEIVTRGQIFSAGFYNNATVASMLEMVRTIYLMFGSLRTVFLGKLRHQFWRRIVLIKLDDRVMARIW
ncbi:hypothetical protein Tco_1523027 [Tanacetum coccineum]